MNIDPKVLAQHIANTLDGNYGPGDAGYIGAYLPDEKGDRIFIEYQDDEFGRTSHFILTLEAM